MNDDPALEKEADVMGEKALQLKSSEQSNLNSNSSQKEIIQKSNDATGTQSATGTQGERIKSWIASNGHAHLLKDIDESMNEAAIIGQLIENFFNRSDFTYDFSAIATFEGRGDCSTLSNEFVKICKEVFQIEGMSTDGGKEGYLIVGGGKIVHNKQVTGNIDSGKHWYFDSHTWALWKGKPIDVLFGQLGIKDHQAGIKDTPKDGGVEFEGGSFPFWIKEEQTDFDKYTTKPELKKSKVKIAKGKKGTHDPNSEFKGLF